MFLTQSGGFIIKPISRLLGAILSLLYHGLNAIGVESIGIAIILFTLIVRLIIFPLMYKQNRSSKIMSMIQPEINKATKKYRGKTDQQSMMEVQRITKEIQSKYGVSMTSGCLTSLIQLPIFLALYRVIQNIPAYVPKVYDMYKPIAVAIQNNTKAQEALTTVTADAGKQVALAMNSIDYNNTNTVIDVLANFSEKMWNNLANALGNTGDVVNAMFVNNNVDNINHVNNFFGLNLTEVPGFAFRAAIIIPILSLIFQFLSMKVTNVQTSDDPTQQATMGTMKTMMYIMPIFSFFVCVNVPCGVGLYWAVGAFISFITTICTNAYFKHCDMDKILEKSMAKAAKKNAKKKKKNKKSFMEKMQEAAYGQASSSSSDERKVENGVKNASLKSYSSNTMKSGNDAGTKYRAGSLASKANIMQNYNNDKDK